MSPAPTAKDLEHQVLSPESMETICAPHERVKRCWVAACMQDVQGDTDQCEGCRWVSQMSIDCQEAAHCQEGGQCCIKSNEYQGEWWSPELEIPVCERNIFLGGYLCTSTVYVRSPSYTRINWSEFTLLITAAQSQTSQVVIPRRSINKSHLKDLQWFFNKCIHYVKKTCHNKPIDSLACAPLHSSLFLTPADFQDISTT